MNTRTRNIILGVFTLIAMGATEAGQAGEFGNSYEETRYPGRSEYTSLRLKVHGRHQRRASSGPLNEACHTIRSAVQSIVGGGNTECYLKLFNKESSCEYNKPQKKGNAGNPYAAYGLCSIERSPAVRAANGRGAACNDISSLSGQIRCCQSMMRNSPTYFGPIRRREVSRCG